MVVVVAAVVWVVSVVVIVAGLGRWCVWYTAVLCCAVLCYIALLGTVLLRVVRCEGTGWANMQHS